MAACLYCSHIVICAAGAVACGRPDAQLCSKAKICVSRNLLLIFVAAKEILINVTQTPADAGTSSEPAKSLEQ